MKTKKLALGVFAILLAMASVGMATLTATWTTPSTNNSFQSARTLTLNVSSDDVIWGDGTYIEWRNESGDGSNLTLTIVNSTKNYTYASIAGMVNGKHTFHAVIHTNTTGGENSTAVRYINIDYVAPTVTISDPTSSQEITRLDTSGTTTIDLNFTPVDNNIDDCFYEIYSWETRGGYTLLATNATVSCTNNTGVATTVTPSATMSTNEIRVHVNDSAGLQGNATVVFTYTVTAVGGGSSSGGGGGGVLPASWTGQPSEPTGTEGTTDNRGMILLLVAVGAVLLFGGKKKRK